MRLGFFLLCFLPLLVSPGCTPETALTPADYRALLPTLEADVRARPTDAEAFRDLGVAYAQLQRFERARDVLQRAYEIDGRDPETRYYLGVAHEGAGYAAEALHVLGQYESVSPDSPYRALMEARHTWLRRELARRELRTLLVMDDSLAAARATDAVAVFPFLYRGSDPRYEVIGRGLGEMLTVDLASTGRLEVVERVRLQALLNEVEISQGEAFNPQTAPRIGRLLQSGRVVGGSFDVMGERLQTDVVLWEWKTEPLPALSDHAADLDALFRLEKEIAFALLDELGVRLTPAERDRIERVPTRDLQAFLAFSRGLHEEDAGNFGAAAAQFQQAAQLDPGFDLATQRVEKAQALSATSGSVTAALGARAKMPGAGARGGAGGAAAGEMTTLMEMRLSDLTESIGMAGVPAVETAPEVVPLPPPAPAIEPIPDPPPPPGGN
jgi:tetratricopeptide (TPR) repeat protein